MTRRELFKALALSSSGALAAQVPARKFGYLDVEGYRAHLAATNEYLRVTLDGVDVTKRCVEADDVVGYVELFCRDPKTHRWDVERGALHVRGGGACRHRLHGTVVIAPAGGVV